MSDYISREAVIDFCEKQLKRLDDGEAYRRLDAFLNVIPDADVRENKRGKWYISLTEPFGAVCDSCGFAWSESIDAVKLEPSLSKIETPYCPNCGARMEEQT